MLILSDRGLAALLANPQGAVTTLAAILRVHRQNVPVWIVELLGNLETLQRCKAIVSGRPYTFDVDVVLQAWCAPKSPYTASDRRLTAEITVRDAVNTMSVRVGIDIEGIDTATPIVTMRPPG